MSFRAALPLLCTLACACGASSALDDYAREDAGTDASDSGPDVIIREDVGPRDAGPDIDILMDAGPDAPDVGPPVLEVFCSPPQMVRPGGTAEVFAEVASPVREPVRHQWQVIEGTDVSIASPSEPFSIVSSPTEGRKTLRYIITDAAGSVGTCTTAIAVVNGPPIAVCPVDEVVGPAGMPILVEGQGFDDEGIIAYEWTLLDGDLEIFEPESPATTVLGERAGTNTLLLTVVDTDGDTDSCMATVRLTAPPQLMCPGVIEAPTRQRLDLVVPVRDDRRVVGHRWDILDFPPSDGAFRLRNVRENRASMTPARQGVYLLQYTATDDDGLSSSCLIEVIGTPTPPTLDCPEEIRTRPLRETEIAVGFEDDGEVLRWQWSLSESPDGSAARAPRPAAQVTRFTPDIAGRYEVTLVATDNDRMTATCRIPVLAISDQGLRIEVNWDTATDMDTHLLNPTATSWNSDDDCYYGNCQREGGLEWFAPGPEDNPRLDIDDVDGFGPENINIDVPADGIYRAAVYAFSGRASATMRIYCGGSRLDPRVTYGPVAIGDNEIWRVADIEIDGVDCEVEALTRPDGRPNVNRDLSRR